MPDYTPTSPPMTRHGVHAANYGTADNPALIQIDNPNGPNATTPLAFTAPAFDPNGTLAQRLLDQQWRDAIALGITADIPQSINPDGP